MDNQKETPTKQLREEIAVTVERLKKMLTSCLEFDPSSYFTCKSYYQQVQSLRKRFYEILPDLRLRATQMNKDSRKIVHMDGNSNEQRYHLKSKTGNYLIAQPKAGTSSLSKQITLVPQKPSSIQIRPHARQFMPNVQSKTKTILILSSEAEEFNSFLVKATEEVDSLTTSIEKIFFSLEAEYNKNVTVDVVRNPDFKNLDGKTMTASSIILNFNGNPELKGLKSLGALDNDPIFKPVQQSTYGEGGEKQDINPFDQTTEVTEVEQEAQYEEITRRKDLFYNRFADTTLEFFDGQTLKVSSAFLIEKSSVFDKILRSLPFVIGCKFEAFKLFLDCLMEFQDCSVDDALQIFPIAYEFKVGKLIEKCKNILRPAELNVYISLTLNMAVSVKCEELVGAIINFLLEKGRIFFLFSERSYYFLLSPGSVRELLSHFEIDSFIMKKIFDWAEHYLKAHDEPVDLKAFFTKHRIMEKLAVACFETMGVKF